MDALTVTVWMDSWQMECCGEPFSTGDAVDWTVHRPDREWLAKVLGPERAAGVDFAEEHHGDADPEREENRVRGTVTALQYVHCRYAPGADRTLHAVPGTALLSDVDRAEKWVEDRGEHRFLGYLVRLRRA
ncbi:DUF6578 domain-containing protein [Streptomyces indicus]|uniref:Uncharacterized protein n=1 Tax=Streptomyces indicus TaxID=417292 RepID=A0A1G8URL7_9ACTN|nr:DUF6578 domain-containing protein [Streptomyces indicus]SDJ55735.1 hypothetical protein SAMN05421806_101985 [Streptomyces indicus]